MTTIARRAPSVRTWFPDEVENILAAVAAANGDVISAIDTPAAELYRRGFDAAMRSVAMAFGVDAPQPANLMKHGGER